ncbi:DotI/IcmL/TraM family protein [Legionella sp. W05-934-2]|jgi:hypothetical protein|uniref:DotI/IcmL/TraM family protein n=1 Tax=Legionella sp. W05-934-2 TaxID=1198649 RepID=UPI0034636FBE
MKAIFWFMSLVLAATAFAGQADLGKKIWAQQAILATYQVSNSSYIADQREIAKYFTADAWKKYLQVLEKVQFQQFIEKNNYHLDAVALKPVTLKPLEQGYWQASMPVLVQYTNPQYNQLQTVEVTIQFKPAPSGQGVLGYQMVSFLSKNMDKPCQCMVEKGKENLSSDKPTPNEGKS